MSSFTDITSIYASKITELLGNLMLIHFEEFSTELFDKIKNNKIDSIDNIREIWNSKCKENILHISNTSIILKTNKKEYIKTENIKVNEINEKAITNSLKDKICTVILNKGKKKITPLIQAADASQTEL